MNPIDEDQPLNAWEGPVYKPCQIVGREVGVKSVDKRRRRHGHKPVSQSSLLQRFPQIALQYRCLEAFFLVYVNPFYPFHSGLFWSQNWSHPFQDTCCLNWLE